MTTFGPMKKTKCDKWPNLVTGINDHITIGHLSNLNEIKINMKINDQIWSQEAHILMWEYLFKVIKERIWWPFFTHEYLQRRISAELQFKMVWEGQGREGSVEYEFYSFLPRTKVFSSLNSRR